MVVDPKQSYHPTPSNNPTIPHHQTIAQTNCETLRKHKKIRCEEIYDGIDRIPNWSMHSPNRFKRRNGKGEQAARYDHLDILLTDTEGIKGAQRIRSVPPSSPFPSWLSVNFESWGSPDRWLITPRASWYNISQLIRVDLLYTLPKALYWSLQHVSSFLYYGWQYRHLCTKSGELKINGWHLQIM